MSLDFVRHKAIACALASATLLLSGCKQETVFTRVPAHGTVQRDAKPTATTVFLSVPVTLDRFLAEAERLIPQQVSVVKEVVEDGACDRRKASWIECANARFEGELLRDGPVGLKLADGRLQMELPASAGHRT